MKELAQELTKSVHKALSLPAPQPSSDPFFGQDANQITKKLEEAYSHGCTDSEACAHAKITLDQLKQYELLCPQTREHKSLLRSLPLYYARQTLTQGLQTDPKLALTFLKNIDKLTTADPTDTPHQNLIDRLRKITTNTQSHK